jgi:hypothetical protein
VEDEAATAVQEEAEGTVHLNARTDGSFNANLERCHPERSFRVAKTQSKDLRFDCTTRMPMEVTIVRCAKPTRQSSPGSTPRSGRHSKASAL